MEINNLNITTDPEYLNIKVTLRRENDQNVVDMAVDMLKDIGNNAFVIINVAHLRRIDI